MVKRCLYLHQCIFLILLIGLLAGCKVGGLNSLPDQSDLPTAPGMSYVELRGVVQRSDGKSVGSLGRLKLYHAGEKIKETVTDNEGGYVIKLELEEGAELELETMGESGDLANTREIIEVSPGGMYKIDPVLQVTKELKASGEQVRRTADNRVVLSGEFTGQKISGRAFNPKYENEALPEGKKGQGLRSSVFGVLQIDEGLARQERARTGLRQGLSGMELRLAVPKETWGSLRNDEDASLAGLEGFQRLQEGIAAPMYLFHEDLGEWKIGGSGWFENDKGEMLNEEELEEVIDGVYEGDVMVACEVTQPGWYNLAYPMAMVEVAGRVLGADGNGLSYARVGMRYSIDGVNAVGEELEVTYTDREGRFGGALTWLPGMEQEGYGLVIEVESTEGEVKRFDNEGRGYLIRGGEQADLGELQIASGSGLQGTRLEEFNLRVEDETGTALEGATVSLWNYTERENRLCAEGLCEPEGVTDANGQVNLRLPVGSFARLSGYVVYEQDYETGGYARGYLHFDEMDFNHVLKVDVLRYTPLSLEIVSPVFGESYIANEDVVLEVRKEGSNDVRYYYWWNPDTGWSYKGDGGTFKAGDVLGVGGDRRVIVEAVDTEWHSVRKEVRGISVEPEAAAYHIEILSPEGNARYQYGQKVMMDARVISTREVLPEGWRIDWMNDAGAVVSPALPGMMTSEELIGVGENKSLKVRAFNGAGQLMAEAEVSGLVVEPKPDPTYELLVESPEAGSSYEYHEMVYLRAEIVSSDGSALEGGKIEWINDAGEIYVGYEALAREVIGVGEGLSLTAVLSQEGRELARTLVSGLNVVGPEPVYGLEGISPESGKRYESEEEIIFEGSLKVLQGERLGNIALKWLANGMSYSSGDTVKASELGIGENIEVRLQAWDQTDHLLAEELLVIAVFEAEPPTYSLTVESPVAGMSYGYDEMVMLKAILTSSSGQLPSDWRLEWINQETGMSYAGASALARDVIGIGEGRTLTVVAKDAVGKVFATTSVGNLQVARMPVEYELESVSPAPNANYAAEDMITFDGRVRAIQGEPTGDEVITWQVGEMVYNLGDEAKASDLGGGDIVTIMMRAHSPSGELLAEKTISVSITFPLPSYSLTIDSPESGMIYSYDEMVTLKATLTSSAAELPYGWQLEWVNQETGMVYTGGSALAQDVIGVGEGRTLAAVAKGVTGTVLATASVGNLQVSGPPTEYELESVSPAPNANYVAEDMITFDGRVRASQGELTGDEVITWQVGEMVYNLGDEAKASDLGGGDIVTIMMRVHSPSGELSAEKTISVSITFPLPSYSLTIDSPESGMSYSYGEMVTLKATLTSSAAELPYGWQLEWVNQDTGMIYTGGSALAQDVIGVGEGRTLAAVAKGVTGTVLATASVGNLQVSGPPTEYELEPVSPKPIASYAAEDMITFDGGVRASQGELTGDEVITWQVGETVYNLGDKVKAGDLGSGDIVEITMRAYSPSDELLAEKIISVSIASPLPSYSLTIDSPELGMSYSYGELVTLKATLTSSATELPYGWQLEWVNQETGMIYRGGSALAQDVIGVGEGRTLAAVAKDAAGNVLATASVGNLQVSAPPVEYTLEPTSPKPNESYNAEGTITFKGSVHVNHGELTGDEVIQWQVGDQTFSAGMTVEASQLGSGDVDMMMRAYSANNEMLAEKRISLSIVTYQLVIESPVPEKVYSYGEEVMLKASLVSETGEPPTNWSLEWINPETNEPYTGESAIAGALLGMGTNQELRVVARDETGSVLATTDIKGLQVSEESAYTLVPISPEPNQNYIADDSITFQGQVRRNEDDAHNPYDIIWKVNDVLYNPKTQVIASQLGIGDAIEVTMKAFDPDTSKILAEKVFMISVTRSNSEPQ